MAAGQQMAAGVSAAAAKAAASVQSAMGPTTAAVAKASSAIGGYLSTAAAAAGRAFDRIATPIAGALGTAVGAVRGALSPITGVATAAAGAMAGAFARAGPVLAAGVQAGARAATAALGGLQQALGGLQAGFQRVGDIAFYAFTRAGLPLAGLVTAGIAASAMGQVLAFQMERLARTVAGLFAPEIQRVIGFVTSLTNRLQALTDAQRSQIVRWIEAAAAGLAMAIILPKLVGGIYAVVGAVRALTAAMVASGWGAILPIIGLVAGAFLAIGAGAEVAQGGLGKLWATVQPLFGAFAAIAGKVMAALEPVLAVATQVFEGLVAAVMSAVPAVVALVGSLAETFGGVVARLAPLVQLVVGVFQGWVEMLGPLLEIVGQVVSALAGALVPIIGILARAWGAGQKVLQAIIGAYLTFVKECLVPIQVAIYGVVEALMEALAPAFDLVNDLLGLLVEGFKLLIPWVIGFAKIVVNVVVTALKALTWVLKEIASFISWITGKSLDVKATTEVKQTGIDADAKRGGRGALAPKAGGPEAFEALWSRLAQASRLGGAKDPQEKSNDWLEKIFGEQKKTTDAVKGKKPPIEAGRG